MPIKLNDFVELEYTGKLKDGGIIFDTTDAAVAKAHDLPKAQYGPVVVCIGQGQLLKGLEAQLVGKEPGNYTIELTAEHAFGKKNAKLIQMIPAKKFLEQKIQPIPGLQLNIDGAVCTIRQVTGGRVMTDFNHPLAGRDVVYDVKVIKTVADKKEQLKAVFAMLLNLQPKEITVDGSKAKIDLPVALPEPLVPELQKKLKELTGVDAEITMPKKDAKAKDEHAGHNHGPGEHGAHPGHDHTAHTHEPPKAAPEKKAPAKKAGQQKLA
jgi:FKBP-type peptidyl-prolyl cis-trans isomerase 2